MDSMADNTFFLVDFDLMFDDVGYTDESGLRELVEKAAESMKDMEIAREKDLVNRFMREVRKGDEGLAVYGGLFIIL